MELKKSPENMQLFRAAAEGSVRDCEAALSQGAELNAENGHALMLASCNGHVNVVSLLLNKGAEVSVSGADGTPLMLASCNGHVDVVRLLLDRGAAVNMKARDVVNWDGDLTAIGLALENRHMQVVGLLLDKGAEMEPNGLTLASECGDLEVIRLMLRKGAKAEPSALVKASENGHLEVVRLLLDKGVAVNAKVNNDNEPILVSVVAEDGSLVCVQYEATANIDEDHMPAEATDMCVSPLWMASHNGYVDIVKLLLDKGADIDVKSVIYGASTLQTVVDKLIKLILGKEAEEDIKKIEADIMWLLHNDTTALMMASKNGHAEIVRLLLSRGAEINMQTTNCGKTALMFASRGGHLETVKLLLDSGADVNVQKTDDGATALLMATKNGHTEVVRLLLSKGAQVNIRSNYGTSDLTTDLRENHARAFRVLGTTALDVAVIRQHTEIAQVLAQAKAERL